MNKFKDPEHNLLWAEIHWVKESIKNHITTRLDRIDSRMWKGFAIILTILGTLSIALILALLKILP